MGSISNDHTRDIQRLEQKRREQYDDLRKSYRAQLENKDEVHETRYL